MDCDATSSGNESDTRSPGTGLQHFVAAIILNSITMMPDASFRARRKPVSREDAPIGSSFLPPSSTTVSG